MHRLTLISVVLVVLLAGACGGETTGGNAPAGGGGDGGEGGDLLTQIQDSGTLTASTDPAYPPQSSQNAQGEFVGFDIDVTKEIAKRLGVDVEFVTPAFDAITAGSWGGRWHLAVGSITITPERQEGLYFTEPYYYTRATATSPTSRPISTGLRSASARSAATSSTSRRTSISPVSLPST